MNGATAVTAAGAGQLELDSPGRQDLFQHDSLRFTGVIERLTHGHRRGLNSLPESLTGTRANGCLVADGENLFEPSGTLFDVQYGLWSAT